MVDRDRMMHFAAACFGAGCVTFLGLLMLEPSFGVAPAMGIALTVGAAVTYLGYRFRDVVAGMRKAARETMPRVVNVVAAVAMAFLDIAKEVVADFRAFFSKPRPFFWLPMIPVLIPLALIAIGGITSPIEPAPTPAHPTLHEVNDASIIAFAVIVVGIVPYLFTALLGGFIAELAVVSRQATKQRWIARAADYGIKSMCTAWSKTTATFVEQPTLPSMGMETAVPYSFALAYYGDALKNIGYGLFVLARFIVWDALAMLVKFVWRAIILVHSADRLIVMVDGPFGGVLTYAVLRTMHGTPLAELSLAQQAGYVLLGGCASVALGMANAHLVAPAIQRFVRK